jgi:FdhD protein
MAGSCDHGEAQSGLAGEQIMKSIKERTIVGCTISEDGRFEERELKDTVVVEEPLLIRVVGESLAMTMRTPGHDRELAMGFLYAEGLVRGVEQIGRLSHCGRPGEEGYGNVIDFIPAAGVVVDPDRMAFSRRGTLTTSACGVCGRESIDDLVTRCAAIEREPLELELQPKQIGELVECLQANQPIFRQTGGLHAAALFDADQELLAAHEDVGRHNAVDKVVGARQLDEKEQPAILVVSGRISFEIVQKAVMAGVQLLIGVSAPSSLSLELAERCGLEVIGFARGQSYNRYV